MITRHDRVDDQFNRIVVHGNTVYVAGLVADQLGNDIQGQCAEVLSKLDGLLATVGSNRSRLLSVTVFLKNFEDYARFKASYARWADIDHLPARATVRADMRDPRMLIEIMAIAACDDSGV